jgi:hypothetical protein
MSKAATLNFNGTVREMKRLNRYLVECVVTVNSNTHNVKFEIAAESQAKVREKLVNAGYTVCDISQCLDKIFV